MTRFGLRVPQHLETFRALEFSKLAERLAYSTIWVNDHLVSPHSNPLASQLESWTLISRIATITSKIRLGTLVMCNPLRHPALVAKMAATLDNLSNGRLELGLGAGWKQEDLNMIGLDKDAAGNLSQLEEAIQLILSLWLRNDVDFQGVHYKVSHGYCVPKPLQKPYPPILLGLSARRQRSINMIAKYADKYNLLGISDESYHQKHEEILAEKVKQGNSRKICAVFSGFLILKTKESLFVKQTEELATRLGLPVNEFLKQQFVISGSSDECVSKLKRFRPFIDEFVFILPDTEYEYQLEQLASCAAQVIE